MVRVAPWHLALASFAFHASIASLLDINFLHGWAPSLAALLVGPVPFPKIPTTLTDALVLVLLAAVVLPALFLYDLRQDAPEITPISCFPVFAHPVRMHLDAHILCLYPPGEAGPPIDPYYVQGAAGTQTDRPSVFDLRAVCECASSNLVVVTEVRSSRTLDLVSNCRVSENLKTTLREYFRLRLTNADPLRFFDLAVNLTVETADCEQNPHRNATVTHLTW